MTQKLPNENSAVPAQPTATDLSNQIEQSMVRQANERIKVVRVFDDYYRCNVWAQEKTAHSFWLANGTITKSSFLHATMTSKGLTVEEVK